MTKGTQMALVPERPPQLTATTIPLDELMGTGRNKLVLVGPPPDRAFIESVKRYGVMVPVIVERKGKGWTLRAGTRRLKALVVLRDQQPPDDFEGTLEEWRARWETVRAEIVETDGWRPELLGTVENEHRSPNLAQLADEIGVLIAEGRTEAEIHHATLVPLTRIRRIVRLLSLHAELRDAYREGKITTRVALTAATCTAEQQEQLVSIYVSEGQLTWADVRNVKMADQRAAQEALAGLETPDLGEDAWIDPVITKLREALEMVPEGHPVREDVQAIIDGFDDGLEEDQGRLVSLASAEED